MKLERFIIYTITDPRDNSLFYIGLTTDFYSRKISHLSKHSSAVTHSKVNEVRASGNEPVFQIIREFTATRDEAVDIESQMILDLALSGTQLVNRHIIKRVLTANNIDVSPLDNFYEKSKRKPYYKKAS